MAVRRPLVLQSGQLQELAAEDFSPAGGLVNSFFSDVTTSGTSAETLITESLPAGILVRDGDIIEAEFFGTFAANANNKVLWMEFATAGDVGSLDTNQNGGSWRLRVTIVRVSSSVIRWIVTSFTDTEQWTDYAEETGLTLSSAIDLKLEGRTPDNAGDLTVRGGFVRFLPKPKQIVTVGGATVTVGGVAVTI